MGGLGIRRGGHEGEWRLHCSEKVAWFRGHTGACKGWEAKQNCHIAQGAPKGFSANTNVIPENRLVLTSLRTRICGIHISSRSSLPLTFTVLTYFSTLYVPPAPSSPLTSKSKMDPILELRYEH